MLFISLILSVVMLVKLNSTARRKQSIKAALAWSWLGAVGIGVFVVFLPGLLLQGILSWVGGLLCARFAPRPRPFLGVTLAAFLVPYIGLGILAWLDLRQIQQQSAPVSMADYLSYERHTTEDLGPPNLPADVHLISVRKEEANLSEVDEEVGRQNSSRWGQVGALTALHDDQVTAFVESPGFGVARQPPALSRMVHIPEEISVPLDEPASSIPAESAATLPLVGGSATLDDPTTNLLSSLHHSSVIDFVYVDGFGYVKDRTRVYGFQPHRFSRNPTVSITMKPWRFRKLELVSLLKHGRPAVYLSKNLPRMSELRKAPTRELDTFEAAALPKLKSDDLVIHSTAQRLRVLGSIRAAEACLACHAGKQGALLGAFSYHLDRGD